MLIPLLICGKTQPPSITPGSTAFPRISRTWSSATYLNATYRISFCRFLADMAVLLDRPISSICSRLWCYVSPVVLLFLLVIILVDLSMKPMTYIAWDSAGVSLPPQTQEPQGVGSDFLVTSWLKNLVITFHSLCSH
ncbi:hypothetical protein GHT09_008406 [Marmota monax]|uniref:Uncharacterized protein n=1 Tax=Marmota monax TaxID=9995 RepID=A0A834QLG1_MARMO|nr:hypothetical protein GHT09_008406 [Marmota monax]